MNEEDIKKMLEDTYDDSKEDTARSWIRDCYSKKMRWVMINLYVSWFILLVPIIISIIQFFRTDQTGYQIMYAAIVVCCSHWFGFVGVFSCVMMQRPRIGREIKRLELRIAELDETVKNK